MMRRLALASFLLVAVLALAARPAAAADEPAPWATEGPTGWLVAAVGLLALAVVAAVLVLARRRARAASTLDDR